MLPGDSILPSNSGSHDWRGGDPFFFKGIVWGRHRSGESTAVKMQQLAWKAAEAGRKVAGSVPLWAEQHIIPNITSLTPLNEVHAAPVSEYSAVFLPSLLGSTKESRKPFRMCGTERVLPAGPEPVWEKHLNRLADPPPDRLEGGPYRFAVVPEISLPLP